MRPYVRETVTGTISLRYLERTNRLLSVIVDQVPNPKSRI